MTATQILAAGRSPVSEKAATEEVVADLAEEVVADLTEEVEADQAEASVPAPPGTPCADGLVEEELLVEEISIDGMCGVY
ncbi:MAG TPA: mycofactocin precursor MftA [Acidimicrobiales bacterium]|nr:mycofactocin precursor MftA [Acidimicrobiales bacterium]